MTEPRQEVLEFDGDPRKHYIFAYGSDMSEGQIRERCSRPVAVGVACLPGHTLGFYGHSEVWDGAVETALPAPGQDLWGVVYELSYTDAQRLDAWHDARLDGAGSSFHYPARVRDDTGRWRTVLLYKKDVLGERLPPSREYLDFLVRGAEARGLPPEYLQTLRGIPTQPASYAVPQHSPFQREITIVTSCAECGG